MENNAFIDIRFIDFLDILDARATITVFVGDDASIKHIKVYEFLAEPELVRKYRNYSVVGLKSDLGITTISIKEEV